ncbi:N-acetyltransferase [Rhizobium grahamii]|uniref:Acetyltransferase n=3 Tax=Rhizobium grahamii TaxID=1120045 RepID=S3HSK1_9HYPH|nr:acetyltransferase [Rhizobium grahamii CCGE 502]RDJ03005.1 N-acetyltransferase [Rhizobium grahamii]
MDGSMNKQNSPVEIRPATAEDTDILGVYGAELIALHHAWDAARFISTGPRTTELYSRYLKDQLGKPDALVLVAIQAGAACGYTFAVLEGHNYMALRGPAGVIHDIFVDANRRRQGVGRTLLDATVSELKHRGATQVVLSTAYRNEAGRRLFAAAGFRPTMVEMTLQLSEDQENLNSIG